MLLKLHSKGEVGCRSRRTSSGGGNGGTQLNRTSKANGGGEIR